MEVEAKKRRGCTSEYVATSQAIGSEFKCTLVRSSLPDRSFAKDMTGPWHHRQPTCSRGIVIARG
jgi:hypothetical protein